MNYTNNLIASFKIFSLTLTPEALLLNNKNPSKSSQLPLLSRELGLTTQ